MSVNSVNLAEVLKMDHNELLRLIKASGFDYERVQSCNIDSEYANAIGRGIKSYSEFMYIKLMDFRFEGERLYKVLSDKSKHFELIKLGIKVNLEERYVDIARSHANVKYNIFDGRDDYGKALLRCDKAIADAPKQGRFNGEIKSIVRLYLDDEICGG